MITSRRVLLIAGAVFAANSYGAIVYDNSVGDQDLFWDSTYEFGDQVHLAGSERTLTEFRLEYFSEFVPDDIEQVRLRIYANDGPKGANLYNTPGTLLYDSGANEIEAGYKTIRASGLSLLVPDSFTWTVQFSGLSPGETAGLRIYDPPTVGSSGNYFWEKQDGQWVALEFPEGIPGNFAARVTAVLEEESAPEIRTIQFSGNQISISSEATVGKLYALEYLESFQTAERWQRVMNSDVRATGTTVILQDPNAATPNRFYRVAERTTSIVISNGQAIVTSHATPGNSYALEQTTNFTSWTRLTEEVQATGSTVSLRAGVETAGFVFFRVVEL